MSLKGGIYPQVKSSFDARTELILALKYRVCTAYKDLLVPNATKCNKMPNPHPDLRFRFCHSRVSQEIHPTCPSPLIFIPRSLFTLSD
jgi:hypothetical protein